MKRPKIEHVAFDLDGVLIDSLEVMRNSWTTVNEKLNIQKTFEAYAEHIGRPFFDILLQLEIPATQWNDIKKIYDEVSSDLISKIKFFLE